MEIKNRATLRFGYLRQSYFVHVHWSQSIVLNVPMRGGQMRRFSEKFECK